MGTKTTAAEVDVEAATNDLKTQKMKGDIPPSPFAPTLSMDVASAGDSAVGVEGTSANALLAMQRELKMKPKASSKAAIAESKKGARDQKANRRQERVEWFAGLG
jgi:hypothetical protein